MTINGRNQLDLAWRDVGSGAPIVLIHGLGGSAKSWSTVARELRASFRVLSFDLPGHGNSPAPGPGLTLTDIADAAVWHLLANDVASPMLVGHSVGGFIALLMLRAIQARALVMVDSEAGVRTMGWLRELPRYQTIARTQGMGVLFDVLEAEDPAMRDLLGRRPDLRDSFREAFSTIEPDGFLAVAEAARSRSDRSGELQDLTIPTTAIVGSLDAAFLQPSKDFAALSGGEVAVLDGVGHMPMLERPDLVTAIIARAAAAGELPAAL